MNLITTKVYILYSRKAERTVSIYETELEALHQRSLMTTPDNYEIIGATISELVHYFERFIREG